MGVLEVKWIGWALAGGFLLASLTGSLTLGVVSTPSMAPDLPPGSLFLALPGQADVGDVVVYEARDGGRVVHRVVEAGPDGLITKGDANERTDQELGHEPVSPEHARPLASMLGVPLVVEGPWVKPVGLAIVQFVLLTWGLSGLMARSRPTRTLRLAAQPAVLLLASAVVLLLAAPLSEEIIEADGSATVRAGPFPTLVHLDNGTTIQQLTLSPMSQEHIELQGQAELVRAPALPGARALAGYGAAWATLPAAGLVGLAALAVHRGWPA